MYKKQSKIKRLFKKHKKSMLKKLSTVNGLFLILPMILSSLFFVALPINTIAESGGMCPVAADMVLIIDRSGSMDYTSRCDWWQLVCKNKPSCSEGYEWVKTITYNESETWCNARNQSAPHNSVYLAIYPKKIDAAKSAANSFLGLMGNNDQSALISYATSATLDKGLSTVHLDTRTAINNLVTSGATNIGDAIKLGIEELKSTRSNPQANHAMILLTDGMANKPAGPGYGEFTADVTYAENQATAAAALGYKIFTIGLGNDGEINETMLQNIANSTGATYYHSASQNDLEIIYHSIANQICTEYGSIAGCVYDDQNNNGTIDSGEPTLSDWQINLTNGTINQTQTLADGCYAFTGLTDGTYTISQTVKDGWQQTYPNGAQQISLLDHNDLVNIDFANHYNKVCTDADGDGYATEGQECGPIDCNDNNSLINPGLTEICDELDNNCNAEIDETFSDLGSACSDGVGMCLNTGTKICSADGQSTICSATAHDPVTEICDGSLDEDCDGTVDEGCDCTNGETKSCNDQWAGIGICLQGTQACTDGVWGECLGAVYPTTEICDGLDNNCNGQTDETFSNLNDICLVGVGKCQASGFYMCSADLGNTMCSVTPGTPDEIETCGNQIDDDCDGAVDENCTSGPVCGNGNVESGETCDDGNVVSGDGCSATCQEESSTEPVCGNQIIETGEECDDGNTTSGDLCSATCQNETPEENCNSSISGKKYNGNQEDNIFLQGWEIKLYDNQENFLTATSTNDEGRYLFEDLCIGTYIIKEVQQTGWQQIFPVDANKNPIFYTDIIASAGTHLNNRDFSNYYSGGSGGDEAVCGNNVREGEEICDGNDGITSDHHCTANCTLEADSPSTGSGSSSGGGGSTGAYCGDGIVNGSEQCENNSTVGAGYYCSNCTIVPLTGGNNNPGANGGGPIEDDKNTNPTPTTPEGQGGGEEDNDNNLGQGGSGLAMGDEEEKPAENLPIILGENKIVENFCLTCARYNWLIIILLLVIATLAYRQINSALDLYNVAKEKKHLTKVYPWGFLILIATVVSWLILYFCHFKFLLAAAVIFGLYLLLLALNVGYKKKSAIWWLWGLILALIPAISYYYCPRWGWKTWLLAVILYVTTLGFYFVGLLMRKFWFVAVALSTCVFLAIWVLTRCVC